jgi:hypothetical protein
MRYTTPFIMLAVLVSVCAPTEPLHAGGSTITLRDLGILQLAAHDLFLVDRELEENLENDMLDLSTVFDHGEENIVVGGEIRNSENASTFSIATGYAHEYLEMVEHGVATDTARERMVRHFHSDLTNALRNMLDGRLPEYTTGPMTMTEDLAFRVIHDFLPGSIVVNGVQTPILSPSLFRHTLTNSELAAGGAPMDGVVDDAFRFITFFTPEGLIVVDLIERDHSFAEQFQTDFTFQHFLDEASDGALDQHEDATRLIYELFAKGMGNYHAYMDAKDAHENDGATDGEDTTGEEGEDGESGEDGAGGSDGSEGADGDDGSNGSDGTEGSDGASGNDGSDGADGSSGGDVNTGDSTATVTLEQHIETENARTDVRDARSSRMTR